MKRRASGQLKRPSKKKKTNQKASVFQQPTLSKTKKSVDVLVTTSPLDSTGLITPLNLLKQGPDLPNLLGTKALNTSIEMDWSLVSLRQNTSIEYGRIMIVYDKQSNGAIPTIPDVLLDVDLTSTSGTDPFSGVNLASRNRFIVIRDIRLMLPLINTTATTALVFPTDKDMLGGHIFRKISLETIYKVNAGGAIADIESGTIFLLTLVNVAAGSEGWSFRYTTSIRYEDNL